jgi:hypothetical protein
MMLALGIAGDLGAHHASRVGLCRSPAHPPDPPAVDQFDLERACARAVVRADAGDDVERQGSAPQWVMGQNTTKLRPSGRSATAGRVHTATKKVALSSCTLRRGTTQTADFPDAESSASVLYPHCIERDISLGEAGDVSIGDLGCRIIYIMENTRDKESVFSCRTDSLIEAALGFEGPPDLGVVLGIVGVRARWPLGTQRAIPSGRGAIACQLRCRQTLHLSLPALTRNS